VSGPPLTRRTFVLRALVGIGAAIGAILAIPIVGFAAAPATGSKVPPRLISTSVAPTLRSDIWTSVGKVADYEIGKPVYKEVERHVRDGWVEEEVPIAIWVVRQTEADVTVFDGHCTHLGCPLSWSDGSGAFVCPCHGGSFKSTGDVVAGPPPRPMVRYDLKTENGEVFIGALPEGA
jgi:menaquinol-cytochrome c reductase iron-sulfur subunit